MKRKLRVLTCMIISLLMVITMIPEFSHAANTAVSGQITGFAPLETDAYYFEGDPYEEDITSKLPSTIDVFLDGSSTSISIEVQWESVEDFDDTDYYFYSMKPIWSDAYSLSPDLSDVLDVPWITIYKEEPLSDEIEPLVSEDELEPIYVDEEEALEEDGQVPADREISSDDSNDSTDVVAPVIDSDDSAGEDPADSNQQDTGSDVDLTGAFMKLFVDEVYAAKTTNTDKVYAYLTGTMGLNMAAACGVMTNMYAESGINPINLENTYNTLYGLSDSEYTKRVDDGKGAYKTKSGKSRNFKTDYCGYGLCQWTSLGRRTNLLNKALKKKVSVGDIDMQMDFLEDELTGSYSSVMNTLKSVPNNAQGAYMAAFVFCMNFEVPANTLSTSASRAKTCIGKGGYWQKYSGHSASVSGKSFLAISGYTYPKTLKTKHGMTVKGYAISNYKLKKVKTVIRDLNGVTKYSASAVPNKTVYSLNKFDSKMLFSKLDSGTYKYIVYAKDSSGKTVKDTHLFTVSGSNSKSTGIGFCMTGVTPTVDPTPIDPNAESTMNLYSFTYPKTLKRGKGFTIKGTIKSNFPLTKAVVKVVTLNGTQKLRAAKALSGVRSYNIKNLDSKMKFGRLKRGTYYYKVIGVDQKGKQTLLKKKFVVK